MSIKRAGESDLKTFHPLLEQLMQAISIAGWREFSSSEWLERFLSTHFFETWSRELLRKQPGLEMATLETRRMFSEEFVFSVSREDVSSYATPLLVLPGVDPVHPPTIGRDVAQIARNAEVMDQWKEPEPDQKRLSGSRAS